MQQSQQQPLGATSNSEKEFQAESLDEHNKSNGIVDTAFAGLARIPTARLFWKSCLLCFIAAIPAMNDGYQNTAIGGIIANRGFVNQFGTTTTAAGDIALRAYHVSLWGGMQAVGLIIGHWIAGLLSDRWGRKGNMYLFNLLFIVAVIIEIFSRNWKVFLVAKTILGIPIGMVQVAQTTYINEVAPPQVRGAALANYSLFFGLGQLFASIALQIVESTVPLQWLRVIYSEWVLVGLSIIAVLLLPESPWYYARKHKHEKAKKALRTINGRVPGYDVEREYAVVQAELRRQEEESSGATIMDLFRRENIRRTAGATLAIAAQPLFGSNVFFAYSAFFFVQAGLPNPFLSTLIIFILLNFFILVSFFTTERVGRRPMFIYGGILMGLFNIGLGIAGVVNPTSTASQNAALAMICLWVITYALSAAPIGFIAASELATPRLRALTTGFAISVYGCVNLIFYC